MMKAVFLDRGTFPTYINIPPPEGIESWVEYEISEPKETLKRCQKAQIILTNKVVLDRHIIEQLPDLELICVTATGMNNIDLEACKDQNVQVVNATDYGTQSVAEHVIMLMLSLSRNLPTYLKANEQKTWSKSPFFCDLQAPVNNLNSMTLTIVGNGTLGRAVSSLASAFGMRIVLAERPESSEIRPGYTEFTKAIRQADVVSLHCPLTQETQHLFKESTFKLMKPSALLINAGRGPLVNEADLLRALESGVIAGAALDVTQSEPPSTDDVIWKLAALPNVIVTPHIAWAADEAMQTLINQILAKIENFLREKPDLMPIPSHNS
jgi:glycerate dehydrogenase